MSMTNQLTFFSNQDAAGSSGEQTWLGGEGIFAAEAGTWGGASVKLQAKGPNGSWIDVSGVSLSANGFVSFQATKGAGLQAVVTGTPTDLYCTATRVGGPV